MKLTVILLLCINTCFAQTNKLDSLKNEWNKNKKNVEISSLLCLEFSKTNKDSSTYYANYAKALAKNDCDNSFAYNALGATAMLNGKLDSAIFYYKIANTAAVNCGNKLQQAQVLINWSFIYILKGENDSTLVLTTAALNNLSGLKNEASYLKLFCKAMKYKGDAYGRLGQFDKATESFLEAKRKNNNTDIQVEALLDGSLGSLYTSKLEFDKAIVYFKNAGYSFEKLGDVVNAELQFSNLANAFIENKNYDSAKLYLKKCDPLLVKINNPVKDAYVNKSWAKLHLAEGDFIKAQEFYDKAIANYEAVEEDVLIGDCYYGKAEIYVMQNNKEMAIAYFLKTEKIYIDNEMPNELSGLYFDLAKFENKIGNGTAAYSYLSKSYAIEDSLRSEKVIEAEKNAEKKYESSIKDLKINNQALAIKSKNKNIAIVTIVAALLALLLFAGLFFYKKLNNQKNKIQQQRQEILHNNRNNIQQLISIFSRQSETTAIKENSIANQERLYTLNLLNKLLYENGQASQADVKDYLTQLGAAKEISTGKEVVIQINAPSINLPSNLLKDIGLIINELTTNSIKYAFANIEKPIIKIDVVQQSNFINLTIADNGNGLPNDFDLNSKRNSFGLEFVKDLVEQHNGKVNAYNNSGACFEMSLMC